jgi:hypothetical protein
MRVRVAMVSLLLLALNLLVGTGVALGGDLGSWPP